VGQTQPVFYYDLGSPQCYLVAEKIMATLPVPPEWEPVLDRPADPGALHRPADPEGLRGPTDPEALDRERIERLAAEHGLQPLRWPANWPPDTERAMLAATYAKRIGRGVAFSLAAFRQAFAGGRDLADENTILIAGAACEMHPTALHKGIELASTHAALDAARRRAMSAGVTDLPAIQIDHQLYCGPGALQDATAALDALAR
jgi:2-hydroxychromene-2-carboxylate isomerase